MAVNASVIRDIEAAQKKQDVPRFRGGDTVRVHAKVVEGGKERVQVFEGIVLTRSATASASSEPSSSTPRASPGSKSCAVARYDVRSSTSSATAWASRLVSRKIAMVASPAWMPLATRCRRRTLPFKSGRQDTDRNTVRHFSFNRGMPDGVFA
jgi:hypothetical protein